MRCIEISHKTFWAPDIRRTSDDGTLHQMLYPVLRHTTLSAFVKFGFDHLMKYSSYCIPCMNADIVINLRRTEVSCNQKSWTALVTALALISEKVALYGGFLATRTFHQTSVQLYKSNETVDLHLMAKAIYVYILCERQHSVFRCCWTKVNSFGKNLQHSVMP